LHTLKKVEIEYNKYDCIARQCIVETKRNKNYNIIRNYQNEGFYLPLNLEISSGTTVSWVNDDSVPHNIQSLDVSGNVIDWFNSPPLNTGDKFEFTFEEPGVYNYYCSFHPWRVGSVTVK